MTRSDDDILTDLSQSGFDIDYTRTASRSRLTFGANYRKDDLVFAEPFFLDLDGDTIIDEAGFSRRDGTVTRASVSTRLETGIDRPISTTYSFDARQRTYSNNDDPDLYDSTFYRAGVTTQLRFTDVMSGNVSASYRNSDFDNEEQRQSEIASISTGIDYALDARRSVGASIGYSRQVEEETLEAGRVETIEEGFNASLSFNQEMRDGELFATFRRSIQDEGFRSTVEIGRNFEQPRYELATSIGITALDDGDPSSLFTLSYSRDLPDGRLGASLRRRVTFNTVDDENILTSANVSYSREVTEVMSFGVDLDVARIEKVSAEEDDEQRTEMAFTASIGRALTRDWSLDLGYRGRYNDEDGADSATSSAVFVRLGRDFVLRP